MRAVWLLEIARQVGTWRLVDGAWTQRRHAETAARHSFKSGQVWRVVKYVPAPAKKKKGAGR
jgi:hypothetical protein